VLATGIAAFGFARKVLPDLADNPGIVNLGLRDERDRRIES
jgi:hypothetical protein